MTGDRQGTQSASGGTVVPIESRVSSDQTISLDDKFDLSKQRVFMTGTQAVIHVAGLTTAKDAAEFEAGNVTGALAVVEAALAAGVPRLVHVSSLAARVPLGRPSQRRLRSAGRERLAHWQGWLPPGDGD